MRKLSALFICCLFFFNSCDDGDVITVELDFDKTLSVCGDTESDNYVVYDIKTDPNESLTLLFPSNSTTDKIFNPSTTESATSAHTFYSENGDVAGTTTFLTGPKQYTLVNVEDHTQAGYSGDVVIAADFPVTVSLITFPTANFSIENINGLTVTYTNSSVDYDHVLWEFGDGITSTVESPVHTFELPGEYMTILKVTKLNCSGSIPECVSEYSDTVDLINERVFLPIVVTE